MAGTPSFDDLAEVLAAVIDVGRDAQQIREATGLSWERAQPAVNSSIAGKPYSDD